MYVHKKLSEIIVDNTIYPRAAFDPETVSRYRETLEAGATLPPLVVMPDGRLLDGRHRYEAYKQAGVEEVEVIVEETDDPDFRSVELNLRHGRPLTREELQQAARRWYGTRAVIEIAAILGVTRQTVQNWVSDLAAEREEAREDIREKALEMRAEGKTQEEVAERLGVPQQTISRWDNMEYPSVKNLTHGYTENGSSRKTEEDIFKSSEVEDNPKDNQSTDENDQEKELDLLKSIIGCRIKTHYGTGGIVDGVSEPYGDGFYTITYKHPINGKKCWINSISIRENTVLCESVPLLIEEAPDEKNPFPDQEAGRQAAEAEREKLLPYSDMVKDFYQQLKKTSELAEHLVTRREDLIKAIAGMEADGMSTTVLANAVIQACDIYMPRIEEARDVLEEALRREIKGVVVKNKFLVVEGGKKNGN